MQGHRNHEKSGKCDVTKEQSKAQVRASLAAQQEGTHLPMQETRIWSLGWEDAWEKEMATHSTVLALEILWIGGDWRATVPGVAKSWTWLSNWTDWLKRNGDLQIAWQKIQNNQWKQLSELKENTDKQPKNIRKTVYERRVNWVVQKRHTDYKKEPKSN